MPLARCAVLTDADRADVAQHLAARRADNDARRAAWERERAGVWLAQLAEMPEAVMARYLRARGWRVLRDVLPAIYPRMADEDE